MKMRKNIISTKSLRKLKGMVQTPEERMLFPLKPNRYGYKLNDGKQRKFSSQASTFLSFVKEEVTSTAERRGEIVKIRKLKRVNKIKMISCERGRKDCYKFAKQC